MVVQDSPEEDRSWQQPRRRWPKRQLPHQCQNGDNGPEVSCHRGVEQELRELQTELAERDREIEHLRSAEIKVRQHAAAEMRAMRAEVAETAQRQEALGHEVREAERRQEQRQAILWRNCEGGTPGATEQLSFFLERLGVPPNAPSEAKRLLLHDAVCALQEFVGQLTLEEESSREASPRKWDPVLDPGCSAEFGPDIPAGDEDQPPLPSSLASPPLWLPPPGVGRRVRSTRMPSIPEELLLNVEDDDGGPHDGHQCQAELTSLAADTSTDAGSAVLACSQCNQ